MGDEHYPKVSTDFIIECLLACDNIVGESQMRIGSTITFVTKGEQILIKRLVSFREIEEGNIAFEQASALAARFKFLGKFLKYLEEERGYTDGGYSVEALKQVNEN
jgi:hypothetical protein